MWGWLFLLPCDTSHKWGCQLKSMYYRAPFDGFRHSSCKFLVFRISPTRTGELNSRQPQRPMRVEDIHTTGCCPVPRRDRLRHCYHHLSAMQFSVRCLTPWLRWTTALFVVLRRYTLPRRGWILKGLCRIMFNENNEVL